MKYWFIPYVGIHKGTCYVRSLLNRTGSCSSAVFSLAANADVWKQSDTEPREACCTAAWGHTFYTEVFFVYQDVVKLVA